MAKYLSEFEIVSNDFKHIQRALEMAVNNNGFYAYIKHSPDPLDSTLSCRAEHYHIFIKIPHSKALTTISNLVGCPEQFINFIKIDFALSIQYLTHKNQPDKTQFNYNEIVSNDYELLEKLYNKKVETITFNDKKETTEDILNIIFDRFQNGEVLTMVDVIQLFRDRSLLSQFSRNYYLIKTLIENMK